MLQSWLWRTVTSTTFHTSMIPADHPLVVPHSASAWAPDHIAGAASFGCSRRYWYTVSRLMPNSRASLAFASPAAELLDHQHTGLLCRCSLHQAATPRPGTDALPVFGSHLRP